VIYWRLLNWTVYWIYAGGGWGCRYYFALDCFCGRAGWVWVQDTRGSEELSRKTVEANPVERRFVLLLMLLVAFGDRGGG